MQGFLPASDLGVRHSWKPQSSGLAPEAAKIQSIAILHWQ
jgi:hypothetical protein